MPVLAPRRRSCGRCRRALLASRFVSKLDRVDIALLRALTGDPRATVVALAERLGLSRNTVQARMIKLEREGTFLSFERTVSPATLGFALQAAITVQVQQTELPRIIQELATIPEIVQGFGLSGTIDVQVFVACRDAKHLFDVDARIIAIPGVERTETHLVMGEVIPYRITPLMALARQAQAQ